MSCMNDVVRKLLSRYNGYTHVIHACNSKYNSVISKKENYRIEQQSNSIIKIGG